MDFNFFDELLLDGIIYYICVIFFSENVSFNYWDNL